MSSMIGILILMVIFDLIKGSQEKDRKKRMDQAKQDESTPFSQVQPKKDSGLSKLRDVFNQVKDELEKDSKKTFDEIQDLEQQEKFTTSENRKSQEDDDRLRVSKQNKINREKREEDERLKYEARAKREKEEEKDKNIAAMSVKLGKKNLKKNVVLGVMFSEIIGKPRAKTRRR